MKKINVKVLFLLIFVGLYVVYTSIPKKQYEQGLACYNIEDYVCAAKNMQVVLKYNSNNLDARYYYVKSLSALGPNYYREKILYNFATCKIDDSAKTVANNTLANWYKEIMHYYPYNYIDQVLSGKNIIRWNKETFPLQVYIEENNNVPKHFKTAVTSAFNKWANSIDFLSFKLTQNPDNAQIILNFENTPKNNCDQVGCHYTTGYTIPIITHKTLKQMHITLYDKDLRGEYVPENKLYKTAIHEIGHALGIMGHSYDKEDIMYSEEKKEDVYTKYKSDVHSLSEADKNTIKLLYRLEADITNTEENKINLIYSPLIIGQSNERLNNKIHELEVYIRKAPEVAAGYINLGGLYAENDDFIKAKNYLEMGLKYANIDKDKYAIYYNLAYVYYRIKDYSQALNYCKKAQNINSTPQVLELMKAINSELKN